MRYGAALDCSRAAICFAWGGTGLERAGGMVAQSRAGGRSFRNCLRGSWDWVACGTRKGMGVKAGDGRDMGMMDDEI